MEFRDDEIGNFLLTFEANKAKIRAFPGCEFLELYRDRKDPGIFFTYSKWQHPRNLDEYRQSELFKSVWATTKAMFRSNAEAWSVDTLHSLT